MATVDKKVRGAISFPTTTQGSYLEDDGTWSIPPSGISIGDAIGGGTANRVLFIDGSGNLADSANLTFTSNRLKVGGSLQIYLPNGNPLSMVAGNTNVTGTGSYNVVFGYASGESLISGVGNMLLGTNCGRSLTTGGYSGAIGYQCLYNEQTGSYNAVFGYRNMFSGNGGSTGNAAFGTENLYSANGADYNFAMGWRSLYSLTSGQYNVAGGYYSDFYNQSGNYNVIFGMEAGKGASGQSHSHNIAMGYRSLYAITVGAYNITLGRQSGDSITSGSRNICVGYLAGQNLTTADDCIVIGNSLDALSATDHDQLNIGGLFHGTLGTKRAWVTSTASAQWTVKYNDTSYFETSVASDGNTTMQAGGTGTPTITFQNHVRIDGSFGLNGTPIVPPTLTDSTTGTAGSDLDDVEKGGVADSDTINDNFASIWQILDDYGLIN